MCDFQKRILCFHFTFKAIHLIHVNTLMITYINACDTYVHTHISWNMTLMKSYTNGENCAGLLCVCMKLKSKIWSNFICTL